MLKPFHTIAEIIKVESRDAGWKITCVTNEMSPEESALLMQYNKAQGNLLFKPANAPFTNDDLKDLPEVRVDAGQKTPGERLHAVLFRLWEQVDPEKKQTSVLFYQQYMERLIDGVKEKLNP